MVRQSGFIPGERNGAAAAALALGDWRFCGWSIADDNRQLLARASSTYFFLYLENLPLLAAHGDAIMEKREKSLCLKNRTYDATVHPHYVGHVCYSDFGSFFFSHFLSHWCENKLRVFE